MLIPVCFRHFYKVLRSICSRVRGRKAEEAECRRFLGQQCYSISYIVHLSQLTECTTESEL